MADDDQRPPGEFVGRPIKTEKQEGEGEDERARPHSYVVDHYLPIHTVGKIMKTSLPQNAKVSTDAKRSLVDCGTEFVSFVTMEAAERCGHEDHKTISGEDILTALTALGFEAYVEPLTVYLQGYREQTNQQVKRAHAGGGHGGAHAGAHAGVTPHGAAGSELHTPSSASTAAGTPRAFPPNTYGKPPVPMGGMPAGVPRAGPAMPTNPYGGSPAAGRIPFPASAIDVTAQAAQAAAAAAAASMRGGMPPTYGTSPRLGPGPPTLPAGYGMPGGMPGMPGHVPGMPGAMPHGVMPHHTANPMHGHAHAGPGHHPQAPHIAIPPTAPAISLAPPVTLGGAHGAGGPLSAHSQGRPTSGWQQQQPVSLVASSPTGQDDVEARANKEFYQQDEYDTAAYDDEMAVGPTDDSTFTTLLQNTASDVPLPHHHHPGQVSALDPLDNDNIEGMEGHAVEELEDAEDF